MAGTAGSCAQDLPTLPSFDYSQAHSHEIKPHRHTIPMEGVRPGFNQLRLTLVVSPYGVVVSAVTDSGSENLKYWPELKGEVLGWTFEPFLVEGKPVTAKIEEYIDPVPPERFPTTQVTPPVLRPDSQVSITLHRSVCYGTCPAYTVTVSTTGVVFDGERFVAATGKHTAPADPEAVRNLAVRFIAADFYSMNASYIAGVTDNPAYDLSISIDGRKKGVHDYVGQWVGMPAIIVELEDAVDELAQTRQWIKPAQ
ncbi:MAG: DUF6438 domain-containing protein [Terracidiphilus sp.]